MKKFYAFAAAALMAVAANAQVLYITGAGGFTNGEWNAETPDEFEMVDGNYVLEVGDLTQFKLSTACGDWDAFNAGCYGCNYGEEPGATVALETPWEANIMCPWKGDYKIVVSGDLSSLTLTTTTPKPEGPTPIYLRGDMNEWGASEEWQMESLGNNVWKFVCAEGQEIAAGNAFKIADADWNVYNIGAGDDPTILFGVDTEVFNGGNPQNITLEDTFNGVAWLVLDLEGSGSNYIIISNDKTFVPDWYEGGEDTAVAEIAVEEGEAVYYTLQGVKVANPANGIYVVVKAGKATKAVVK